MWLDFVQFKIGVSVKPYCTKYYLLTEQFSSLVMLTIVTNPSLLHVHSKNEVKMSYGLIHRILSVMAPSSRFQSLRCQGFEYQLVNTLDEIH